MYVCVWEVHSLELMKYILNFGGPDSQGSGLQQALQSNSGQWLWEVFRGSGGA